MLHYHYMAIAQAQEPLPNGVMKFTILVDTGFGGPFLGHHYITLSLYEL